MTVEYQIIGCLCEIRDELKQIRKSLEKEKPDLPEDNRLKADSPCLNCLYCEGNFINKETGNEFYICQHKSTDFVIIPDIYAPCKYRRSLLEVEEEMWNA